MLLYPKEAQLEERFYLWALRLPNQSHPDTVSAVQGSGDGRRPAWCNLPSDTCCLPAAHRRREPGPSAPRGGGQARWATHRPGTPGSGQGLLGSAAALAPGELWVPREVAPSSCPGWARGGLWGNSQFLFSRLTSSGLLTLSPLGMCPCVRLSVCLSLWRPCFGQSLMGFSSRLSVSPALSDSLSFPPSVSFSVFFLSLFHSFSASAFPSLPPS